MGGGKRIKSVAVVGAGAAGAVTAAALKAEEAFDVIRVFERREAPGGTWIYDEAVQPDILVGPGARPPEVDLPLEIPANLPRVTPPNTQERFSNTPVYSALTTNVPDVAMCLSDSRFPYGPFVPHHIPRQYIENYFAIHKTDSFLALGTTVEDISQIEHPSNDGSTQWKLTLRKYDGLQDADVWWEEVFDAVILANGHYAVPSIPHVDGLDVYIRKFPGRVIHSKTYRKPETFAGQKVIVIGNSASGHDIVRAVATTAKQPVYQSIRTKSTWDPEKPPKGIEYKPVIKEYLPSGRVVFDDGTYVDNVDTVIYCTGYSPSFPFWNVKNNGRPLWDYKEGRLAKNYQHTFFQDFSNLGIVGIIRALTFRSFEYQAIALARLFAGRNAVPLPPVKQQGEWELARAEDFRKKHRPFHDIIWENGELHEWLGNLFKISGLGTLTGQGLIPPPLSKELVDVIEHPIKKPEGYGQRDEGTDAQRVRGWGVVERRKDSVLGFI
ncbi:Thiol-specific monooxygenase [Cladobotryum mycophilum]|uniref:Thiol-specific monooxygenase n=1 Tax=Cladobotryum mycophilum TaxID=491253 RepID=A0ABR0SSA6_9HYPO